MIAAAVDFSESDRGIEVVAELAAARGHERSPERAPGPRYSGSFGDGRRG